MKLLCVLLLSFTVLLPISAQVKSPSYQVSGLIVGKITGEGVPYATIILKNDSIKVNKMQACDVSGKFVINLNAPDKYSLTVTSIGYTELNITIKVSDLKTNLGKLSLEEGTAMKEVVITAQKPLVKIDVDKIVYSMNPIPKLKLTTLWICSERYLWLQLMPKKT